MTPLNVPSQAIRRLFGDSDGNGTTDGTDFGGLGFGGVNIPIDYDNNGTVDGVEFGQFGKRFGVTI